MSSSFYERALSLEQHWDTWPEKERLSELEKLKEELLLLKDHEDPNCNKLAQLSRCLSPDMDLKKFYTVLVPIERFEKRKLDDSHFVVTSTDREKAADISGPLVVVLDNIRSAFNVGSISRICDCVGAERIYTCGYTAALENPQTKKSSLGSEDSLDWVRVPRVEDAIRELRAEGYKIYALETAKAQSLYQEPLPERTAFVLGNERFGLDPSTLACCDGVLEIPTFGRKNSLNVAVSFSLAAYEWKRQQYPDLFL